MKKNLIAASIATSLLMATAHLPAIAQNNSGSATFYCGQAIDPSSNSVLPATLINRGTSEPGVLIIWKSERFPKYTPQQRCEIVSPKFEAAIQEGRYYLTSGDDSRTGQGIICAVSGQEEKCDTSKMLFTLKSYQNANDTIEQLSLFLRGTINVPSYQNGGGKYVVDLRDFSRRK